MTAPVRYPNGVTNRRPNHVLASLPILDPTKHVVFHDDFTSATIAASGVTGWHLDETDVGGNSVDLAATDAHGGVAAFTNGGNAGSATNYQWATNTTVHEIFKLQSGRKAWMRVRFKTEDADQDAMHAGLHVATDDATATEPTDQFMFRTSTADADALVFAAGKTASTEVTISLGNLADDTWVICTAYYDGADTVYAWRESADGTVTHSGSVSVTSSTSGDLLPDTEMTVGFGMETLDTGADVFSIDYITVVVER